MVIIEFCMMIHKVDRIPDDFRARYWTTGIVTVIVNQLKECDMNLRESSIKFISEAAKYGKCGFELRRALI
jgi:hypothetical protein